MTALQLGEPYCMSDPALPLKDLLTHGGKGGDTLTGGLLTGPDRVSLRVKVDVRVCEYL